jgi:Fe-S cluster assembly protein SufD
MTTPLTTRILAEYAGSAAAADARSRHHTLEALRTQGLPTTRDENWKYANLRALERQRFLPVGPQDIPAGALLPAPIEGFSRYVFIDGMFVPRLSAALEVPGASLTPGAPGESDASADERLALLNQLFAPDGLNVRVRRPDGPARLEILCIASAGAAAGTSYPRIGVALERGAVCTLIERHLSARADASFVNSVLSVSLSEQAQLDHYRLQDLNTRSILFDTLSAELATAARYRLHAIATGAQAARATLVARLMGEQAHFLLGAATVGDAQQVQDTYALVEHQLPAARSEQTFRGIAAGRARVAFNGKIVVAKGAHGTDSRQSLRGLLAGPEAEIDVRPQLEIYTDDVRCSHGATAGKLDDNMLFYLLSRGLSRDTAQRLLKWAFLEDVVAQIAVPALRRQIEERFAGQLRDATLLELL